jgi:uncharacterized RDD family membrane protein YckC
MSSLASGPDTAASLPPASLDRRFYAFALDRAIAWGLDALAVLVAWQVWFDDGRWWPGIVLVVATVLFVGLGFAALAGTVGTSPGKAVFGLRLVDHDQGTPIGVRRALLRALVLGLAGIPTFGLGLATLAQTALTDPERQRRGWHDRVCGGIVVDLRPTPEIEQIVVERPHQIVNLTAMRLAPVEASPPPRPAPAPVTPRGPEPRPVPAVATASAPPKAPRAARRLTLQPIPPPVPDAPPPPPVERPSARWTVTFDTGESLVVEGLALVGRRPEGRAGEPVRHLVPLPSKDMSLSKTHAQFQVAPDGTLVVMDRGSTNGSTLVRSGVSRELPPGKPTSLLTGDVVRFGDRFMKVYRED